MINWSQIIYIFSNTFFKIIWIQILRQVFDI